LFIQEVLNFNELLMKVCFQLPISELVLLLFMVLIIRYRWGNCFWKWSYWRRCFWL